jgi:hypothetical protein
VQLQLRAHEAKREEGGSAVRQSMGEGRDHPTTRTEHVPRRWRRQASGWKGRRRASWSSCSRGEERRGGRGFGPVGCYEATCTRRSTSTPCYRRRGLLSVDRRNWVVRKKKDGKSGGEAHAPTPNGGVILNDVVFRPSESLRNVAEVPTSIVHDNFYDTESVSSELPNPQSCVAGRFCREPMTLNVLPTDSVLRHSESEFLAGQRTSSLVSNSRRKSKRQPADRCWAAGRRQDGCCCGSERSDD